jgi:hypothetical protein
MGGHPGPFRLAAGDEGSQVSVGAVGERTAKLSFL